LTEQRPGSAPFPSAAVALALFLGGIGIRIAALAVACRATGLSVERLALYFDGHEYITIAQSFPLPYGPDLWLETAWLPGYPLAIALAFQIVGNYAVAALLVSVLASSTAAPLLFALARGRPGAIPAALLMMIGPTMWLTASSLPHSESLFLPLFLATVLLGRRGRFAAALVTGILTAATRHTGVFLTPILLVQCWQRGERRPLMLAACALPTLVLPLLNLYLHTRIPGYPGVLAVPAIIAGGRPFGIPFRTLLEGVAWAPLNPWGTAMNVISLVAVAVGLVVVLWQQEFDFAAWAGAFLGLAISLNGFRAFFEINRYLLPALPVALLALARLHLSRPVVAAACMGLFVVSLEDVSREARGAMALQNGTPQLVWHISRVAASLYGGDPVGLDGWRFHPRSN
jgi:hypothetical protein